jgi:2-methylcitrate dehydratase PrpD
VRIEMHDGSTHALRVDLPLGHPHRPMSAADFDAKSRDCFRAAARPLREDAPRQLRSLVDSLETLDDVRALARVLEPAVQSPGKEERT